MLLRATSVVPITYATAVAAVGMLLHRGARQSLRNHYEQIRHVAHERLMGVSRDIPSSKSSGACADGSRLFRVVGHMAWAAFAHLRAA